MAHSISTIAPIANIHPPIWERRGAGSVDTGPSLPASAAAGHAREAADFQNLLDRLTTVLAGVMVNVSLNGMFLDVSMFTS